MLLPVILDPLEITSGSQVQKWESTGTGTTGTTGLFPTAIGFLGKGKFWSHIKPGPEQWLQLGDSMLSEPNKLSILETRQSEAP